MFVKVNKAAQEAIKLSAEKLDREEETSKLQKVPSQLKDINMTYYSDSRANTDFPNRTISDQALKDL